MLHPVNPSQQRGGAPGNYVTGDSVPRVNLFVSYYTLAIADTHIMGAFPDPFTVDPRGQQVVRNKQLLPPVSEKNMG